MKEKHTENLSNLVSTKTNHHENNKFIHLWELYTDQHNVRWFVGQQVSLVSEINDLYTCTIDSASFCTMF